MNQEILVTGGCGFIGSNFIRHILNKYQNYIVINLDKLTYAGNLDNLKDLKQYLNRRYYFIKGDIADNKKVETIFKKYKNIDYILNFAAESHVDRSIVDPEDFIQTNIYGTKVLLETARRYGVSRYIQISTDEIYGSIKSGSFTEESPPLPNSPYSASKASADLLVRSYFITHNLPAIITRSSNNFGPYQYPEKVIPLFITNLFENKKVPLYGDGLNVRDWLFVLDNCSAIDLVMHKGRVGEIYNIGTGNEITNLQLTRLILTKMGKNKKYIKYITDRLGHDKRYSLDCNKIEKLGWKPEYNFKYALDLTICWYKNNRTWWQKLK